METGNATQQDVNDAVEAENSAEEAAQLSSLAEKASEDFEDIREQATLDQQDNETAMQESKQATEQAESLCNLANSAEELLEEFSNPFSSELLIQNCQVQSSPLMRLETHWNNSSTHLTASNRESHLIPII